MRIERMNNRVGEIIPVGKRLRVGKPLPKRGQIKSKIAANALHSIVSVLSRASSPRHHQSPTKA
ncbi:hypothetical protein G2W53_019402 [Senna tora]|uniref:Uncharacterized protein n=1 Tax=Senna tora TaxID=362788 RepID=A0A834TTJ2_9FABA|nr:hypothetical protein G2W53_019402 [Senna tora]